MEIEKKAKKSEEMEGEKEVKRSEPRRGGIRTLPFILGQSLTHFPSHSFSFKLHFPLMLMAFQNNFISNSSTHKILIILSKKNTNVLLNNVSIYLLKGLNYCKRIIFYYHYFLNIIILASSSVLVKHQLGQE